MAEELSSIVYLGHIPEGFEEKEMKKFFAQFGTVKNVQLSRSKKTGNSKHYGWIEFETPEIATIVAKAMDKYLLFQNLLVCNVVPSARVHPMLFKNAVKGPKKQREVTPLTKKELGKLQRAVKEKGLTIVAVRMFVAENGYAKLLIALARGKKEYDKRQSIKEKDMRREMERY